MNDSNIGSNKVLETKSGNISIEQDISIINNMGQKKVKPELPPKI